MEGNARHSNGKQGFWSGYRATLKSMDTEETFDLIFYRPIGYAWAMLCKKAGVTPNAITIASIFIGIAAGVMMYFPNLWWQNVVGMLLLVWANSFDSADGQLARMTGKYSRIGRILDGLSGDIWFVTIYVAICLRENMYGDMWGATTDIFTKYHWIIWAVAVLAGICHATQAAMADYYRQFHLFFVNGKSGSELDTAALLWPKWHGLSWTRNFWQKLTLMFYLNYTVGQEKRTRQMQRLRRNLQQKYGDEIPQNFRDRFRRASKPLMKYTNILSFNTRCFALFASLIAGMPWLYFAFELTVLNLLLINMTARHESICHRFADELEQ